jgi:sugar/nucleoside kinase (ribokinase family)
MKKISAVVAGHICLDIIPDLGTLNARGFAQAFQPGRMIEVGNATLCTGGPVSNTGLALHKLGISTRLIGKVGNDVFGQAVLEIIKSYMPDLSQSMVVDKNVSTSYSLIISPSGSDRTFLHNPGANHTFSAADVDYDLTAHTRLYHFGYPPIMRRMYAFDGIELSDMMRRVKHSGATTSLDMCFPDPTSEAGKADWRKILSAVLPFVDIFLPSIEELLWLLRRDTYQEFNESGNFLDRVTPALLSDLSQELLEMGVRMLVIKLGERGMYLCCAEKAELEKIGPAAPANLDDWANQELWAPCFKVNVAGTTGSGDSTIAGFLAGLLRGLNPIQTVTMAVAVGACNVEAADALSGLRSWEEITARVSAGWQRLPLDIQDSAWRWDASAELWRKN